MKDRLKNEEVRSRTGVTRELADPADQSVLKWFRHGKNGGGTVGEEGNGIKWERYEVARKVTNRCVKSVE